MKKDKASGLDDNSILVICAHSDDQIFGPGGTISKYAKEGKKVYTLIFSYGEQSHPLHQRNHTIKTRVKEAIDVDKFIGGRGVIFLGLEENKFSQQFSERKMYPKIKKLIQKYKPSRIFTHAIDDPHPDHRNLHKLVLEVINTMKYKGEVFMFDIWTMFSFKKMNYPKIVVDISDTFQTKVRALKLFKSQSVALFMLTWSVYYKAWINGKKIGVKYAEVFYKIR